MTTLQKALVSAALVATVGAGVFEAHQASQLRAQNQTLQQQHASLADQLAQLQRKRDDATNQLALLLAENAQLKSNANENELLKLRGEIGALRSKIANQADATTRNNKTSEQQLADKLSSQAEFIRDDENRKNTARLIAVGILDYVYGKVSKLPVDYTQLTNVVTENFAHGMVRAEDFSLFEFMNMGTEVFIHDARGVTENPDMAGKLVEFREKVARQAPDGIWYRIYSFFGVGGQVVTATSSDGNFDTWEKANTYSPRSNQ